MGEVLALIVQNPWMSKRLTESNHPLEFSRALDLDKEGNTNEQEVLNYFLQR